MKVISSFFFFLISLILCLTLLPHPIVVNAALNLVEEVCEQTIDKGNCLASLESNPDSKQATPKQLGIIALTLASSNATDTSLFIKKLLADKSLDPAIEQALVDCSEQYLDAVQQLDDSLPALLADAHNDVQTWVRAAIADIESCEDGFKEHADNKSVLSTRNGIFRQLCNNALAINTMVSRN